MNMNTSTKYRERPTHKCSCGNCQTRATRVWINPSNALDRAEYCEKHFQSITKSFGKFGELINLQKVKK